MNLFDVNFSWTVTNYDQLRGHSGTLTAQYQAAGTDITGNTLTRDGSIEISVDSDSDWDQLDAAALALQIQASIGEEIQEQLVHDLVRARTTDVQITMSIVGMRRKIDTGAVFIVSYHMGARDLTDPDRYFGGGGDIELDISAPSDNFTPYEQLTEQQVIQWLRDIKQDQSVPYLQRPTTPDHLEHSLRCAIIQKRQPPTTADGMPWLKPL